MDIRVYIYMVILILYEERDIELFVLYVEMLFVFIVIVEGGGV